MSDLFSFFIHNEVKLFQVAYPYLKPWLLQFFFTWKQSMPLLFYPRCHIFPIICCHSSSVPQMFSNFFSFLSLMLHPT